MACLLFSGVECMRDFFFFYVFILTSWGFDIHKELLNISGDVQEPWHMQMLGNTITMEM